VIKDLRALEGWLEWGRIERGTTTALEPVLSVPSAYLWHESREPVASVCFLVLFQTPNVIPSSSLCFSRPRASCLSLFRPALTRFTSKPMIQLDADNHTSSSAWHRLGVCGALRPLPGKNAVTPG
jgi:hypothetical protein